MCDPVSCEKCRNVAGCKEAQAAPSMTSLKDPYWRQWGAVADVDNTAQQVERLALFQKFQGSHEWPASDNPLEVENLALKTSIRQLQDQLADLHSTNIGLMSSNRHLTQLLRAIQSITEAAP